MPPLAAEALQTALQSYQTFARNENQRFCQRLRERTADSSLVEPLATELSQHGKHLRPALTLAAFLVFSGGRQPNRECLAAAHALEIFHTFVLIHDDVIDGSAQRRGHPTLHRRLASDRKIPPARAGNLAIVLGDILFGYTVDLLLDPRMDPTLARPLQKFLAAVTADTGLGEAIELTFLDTPLHQVSARQIEEVYYLKTTRYTIEAPLWLGGRAAGMPEDRLAALAAFARPIGLGFQLENDLHEASLPLAQFERLAYDFQTGVKTLFLQRLHDDLAPNRRRELCDTLAQCQTQRDALLRLHQLIHSTHTLQQLRTEVDDCFAQARTWIPQAPYPPDQRDGLNQLIDYIASKRKHSEAAG